MGNLVPMPVTITPVDGAFTIKPGALICVEPGSDEVKAIAQYFADKVNPATGLGLSVATVSGAVPAGSIHLSISSADPSLGQEGYQLAVTSAGVNLNAFKPAGLFWGIQTLRQLFPAEVEASTLQAAAWTLGTGAIRDLPRFTWRGAMLDVSRHFFAVSDVERYLDLMAAYKLNRLHLHLSDDQGWRIEITSHPELTTVGGSTEVGAGPGGHYSQVQFAELVAYASARYITIIPELEMPGHCNAALASIAGLNCSGVAPALYTGSDVGFSSLCISKEGTYTFVGDVVQELAAISPGPYLHIGGDEASATSAADYLTFMNRLGPIVQSHGKQMLGWEEIAKGNLPANSVIQHWNPWDSSLAQQAASKGAKVIMSPANRAYLDMKYNPATVLGLSWAAFIEVPDAYNWDPAELGVAETEVLGVEAPLWSETLITLSDIEYMAFPRLCGIAEIGWSPATGRGWEEYKTRLGTHGPRLTNMGVNFYPSTTVPWK